jgi:cytochrome c oxidase subunit III
MSDEEDIYAQPGQRAHALHLGMWTFLGSETLLFAGLFALYAAYRAVYPADFALAVHHNNAVLGTVNTVILLTSSFFVATAVHRLRGGHRRSCLAALAIAMVLGACFLGVKIVEYGAHLDEGIAPGHHYTSAELPSVGSRTFFTLYYAMTGLHALHVIAGLAILGWLAFRVARQITNQHHTTELELGGLYWHLVDVVWIFLWPLLYLIG